MNDIRIDPTTGNPLCVECGHHVDNHFIKGCGCCECTKIFEKAEVNHEMACPHLQEVIDVLLKHDIKERRDDPHESVELVCEKCHKAIWICDTINTAKEVQR